uniref:Putative secreted protein n=1 Tax=Anopheles darlingi TaxID=43151 RepID=A0A2M4DQ44_ANODA
MPSRQLLAKLAIVPASAAKGSARMRTTRCQTTKWQRRGKVCRVRGWPMVPEKMLLVVRSRHPPISAC